MATAFAKGINVVTGFSLGKQAPLDYRYTVATIAERDAHVTNGRAYEGMLVYVEADKLIYKYTGSAWVAFGDITSTTVTVDEGETGDIQTATFTTGTSDTAALTLSLRELHEAAGTATKVTYDKKGRITGTEALVASDIPTLTLAKISDAGTAAAADLGKASGNVPVLGADGKLDTDVLPALALTATTVVASEADMLALTAQPGDVAIRTDEKKTYILKASPASTLANWEWLQTPDDVVSSVNGKTGVVVLGTDDVAEGVSNLYYTDARATANFTSNFALASSTSLADTANIVYVGDAIAATCITEDSTHRFVTDDEKSLWNSSAHILVGNDAESAVSTMNQGDFYFETSAIA